MYSQSLTLFQNIENLVDYAKEKEDWQTMDWAILTGAALTNIMSMESSLEAEVKALLSIGETDYALQKAYNSVLPEDRLNLLAVVCNYFISRELDVPRELAEAMEEAINSIENCSYPSEKLIDRIVSIAARIFIGDPDLALRLLAQFEENVMWELDSQELHDYMLVRLLDKVSKNELNINNDALDRIEDEIINSVAKDLAKGYRINQKTDLKDVLFFA